MGRSRKRQRNNTKAMLKTNNLMEDIEELSRRISVDIDFHIKRYKSSGTFNLLEVVKLIAVNHAIKSYSQALSDVCSVDFDPSKISDLLVKSSNKSLLISNMIRLEAF